VNVLTFSVTVSAVIIFVTWMVNDVIPQILYVRKLEKNARLAEESLERYNRARANDQTMELRIVQSPEAQCYSTYGNMMRIKS
jgi:archaellum component FlaF (FlaF/FlaG flagellin family)